MNTNMNTTRRGSSQVKLFKQRKRRTRIKPFITVISIGLVSTILFYFSITLLFKNDNSSSGDTSTLSLSTPSNPNNSKKYIPASVESYIMDHLDKWGWNVPSETVSGCAIWTFADVTTQQIYHSLHSFKDDLLQYNQAVDKFEPIPDLMQKIRKLPIFQEGDNLGSTSRLEDDYKKSLSTICKSASINNDNNPNGIQSLFTKSQQLSYTKTSGYVEPLMPPMRHPDFCLGDTSENTLMRIDYLIHDFESMCMKLKPTSRRILIDMGASFTYKINGGKAMIDLIDIYKKFGFVFDHMYGYEKKFEDPEKVYKDLIPKDLIPAYHWINAGVSSDKDSNLNPLYSIIKNYDEDDLIIVKLDIDTSSIEVPLANQLLHDETLHTLVDQFYFEYHVHMAEMKPWWGRYNHWRNDGSMKDAFQLMYGLRQKGIPAHFWP
jgi:hypothetical protein